MTIGMRALLSAPGSQGVVSERAVLAKHLPGEAISLRKAAETPAIAALLAFEFSTAPGVWPQLPKATLLSEMIDRVQHPLHVDQASTPLCGPAAIVFELVSRDPARYVALMRELYETGHFHGATEVVDPSQDTRDSAKPASIDVADWIMMATLRDTENAVFDVEGDSGDYVMGLSTPWEMKGWAEEVLQLPDTSFTSTVFYGEFDALREAQDALDLGGVAFLLVNSSMLPGQVQPWFSVPQHWISFRGGLVIDEGDPWVWDSGHVKFDCYTWGSMRKVDLGEGPFEDAMFGVVTAVP